MVWRMIRAGKDKPDPLLFMVAKAAAYLIDWSVVDADRQPVMIRDEPADTIQSILDMMDTDDFQIIWSAIEKHADAVAEEKKILRGVPTSGPILLSPDRLAGAMNG